MAKVTGKLIGEAYGITITARYHHAAKNGKDRIWIQLRQNNGKKWRMHTTLAYAKAVDVAFWDSP
jgi:hypothetical protein